MKLYKILLLFICLAFVACKKDDDNASDSETTITRRPEDKRILWSKCFYVQTGDSIISEFGYSGNMAIQLVSKNSVYQNKYVTQDDGNLWSFSKYNNENNTWVWDNTKTIKYYGSLEHSLWEEMLFANGQHTRIEKIYIGDNYEALHYEDVDGEKTLTHKTQYTLMGNSSTTILYKNEGQLIPYSKTIEIKNQFQESTYSYLNENNTWVLKSTEIVKTEMEDNRTTYRSIETSIPGQPTVLNVTEYTYRDNYTASVSYRIVEGNTTYTDRSESTINGNYKKQVEYQFIDNNWELYRITETMYY